MWKKHKFWVILFSLVFLTALGAALLLPRLGSGCVARVSAQGRVVREIDLSRVTEPFEFTVESDLGYNVIRVEPGRILVTQADCPDGICRKTGAISGPLCPILCLPHELVIEILGDGAGGAS